MTSWKLKRASEAKRGELYWTSVQFVGSGVGTMVVVRVNAYRPSDRRVEVEVVGGDQTLAWIPVEGLYEEEA